MDVSDILKSGIGAVVGFALAQTVNLSTVIRDWFIRPKLRIDALHGNWQILMHAVQDPNREMYKEEKFGFYVQNTGRTIATGVQVRLIKIEYRSGSDDFREYSVQTADLPIYNMLNDANARSPVTLLPGAKTLIHLATWHERGDLIFPAVDIALDYYEDICSGAREVRFTVAAFDDQARFTQSTATIRTPR